MRKNQPVTQKEFDYPDDATLMSVTDTQSHISYANAAFIAVSGFDRIGGGVNVAPCCSGTADFFQGDMAEILIYGKVLSSAERSDAYEYLVAKYAIPEPGSLTLMVLALFALRAKFGPRSRE